MTSPHRAFLTAEMGELMSIPSWVGPAQCGLNLLPEVSSGLAA